jgi:hypothetical protein
MHFAQLYVNKSFLRMYENTKLLNSICICAILKPTAYQLVQVFILLGTR